MECEKDGAAVPCGVCPGCRKALAGIHPDVITVDDPDHKAMTVDPIRAARSDMFIRPNEGRRKIYVIPRGQDMNESAQNALLRCGVVAIALDARVDDDVFVSLRRVQQRTADCVGVISRGERDGVVAQIGRASCRERV